MDRGYILWLLARGLSAEAVATMSGYSQRSTHSTDLLIFAYLRV